MGADCRARKTFECFLEQHGSVVNLKWTLIRNKVLNEKNAFAK